MKKLKKFSLILVFVGLCWFLSGSNADKANQDTIVNNNLLFFIPDVPFPEVVTAVVTAYTPDAASCHPFDDGFTSTGKLANTKGVAVDPRKIPYGSLITIDGETYIADDTGSTMRNYKGIWIDIRMHSEKEAREFGKQIKKIIVWGQN